MKTLAPLAGITAALVWVGPMLLNGPIDHESAQDFASDMADIESQMIQVDGHIETAARDLCELSLGSGATHAWGPDAELVCAPPAINQSKPGAL